MVAQRPPERRSGWRKQAWSQTRQAKHAPRAEAEQRAAWRTEAVQILGSQDAVDAMVATGIGHRRDAARVTDEWVAATAARVVQAIQEDRATWQVWHLRAEAARRARESGIRLTELENAADRVVATAISGQLPRLRRPRSTHRHPGVSARRDTGAGGPDPTGWVESCYTCTAPGCTPPAAIVDAEQRIVAAARRGGGRAISPVRVGIAIAERSPTAPQHRAARLVRNWPPPGARVQLGPRPGRDRARPPPCTVLARAWQDRRAAPSLGLAPSAVAAEQLGPASSPIPPHPRRCEATPSPSWSGTSSNR